MQEKLALAISLAAQWHEKQKDKAGKAYIMHCIRVMNKMDQNDPIRMIIAILHDIVEDTKYTLPDLEELGFCNRVLTALDLLWHRPEVPYDRYIEAIATNADATAVKLADLEDNSNTLRLENIDSLAIHVRLVKYHKSHCYLTKHGAK